MNITNDLKLCVDELWTVIYDPSPIAIEIRAIWPKDIAPNKPVCFRHFRSSDYDEVERFRSEVEEYVVAMNVQGYNMYVTLNPLKLNVALEQSARDTDVICRRRLLIDIDRNHGKQHPASDAELRASRLVSDNIKIYLENLNWGDPIRIMSGNGHHLIYRLNDLPNTDQVTQSIRSLLRQLKAKFSNPDFSVDTSVSNAARITKIPGTLARRGIEAEGRPYRVARVYE